MTRNPNWHRELIAQGGKVTNRTGSHFVADCGKGEEAEAFARLFAAAPDLLAALNGIVACCETLPAFNHPANVITRDRMKAAREAIARATA